MPGNNRRNTGRNAGHAPQPGKSGVGPSPVASMRGDGDVVAGLKNKIQSAVANVTPAPILAKQHRKMAEPGTAKKDRGAA